MNDEKYFNFPIQLLSGFLINPKKTLFNIAYYAIYEKYLKTNGTKKDKIKEVFRFYNMSLSNVEEVLINGEELYNSLPINSPKTGLRLSIYWDFFENEKSEFEKNCLLGFLALRSILGTKPYCITTNDFLLSRMDGKVKKINDKSELSLEIEKISSEYRTGKIKNALQNSWGLVYYSRYCRGFYVSFKMNLLQLMLKAEKKRESTKEKLRKANEKATLIEVRAILNRTKPPHDL